MSVFSMVRGLLEGLVGRYGYELKERRLPPRGLDGFVSWLRNERFVPATVIDVGVGPGTPWLYDGFPEARFILVEANADFEPGMQQICQRLKAEYHIFAAGPGSATATLRVNEATPTSSGLLGYSSDYADRQARAGTPNEEAAREVEVRPLDSVLTDNMPTPLLLKVDVEGFELQVLQGAGAILQVADVVILELSVLNRHVGEASIPDVFKFLDEAGFDLLDIAELSTIGANKRLAYLDAAFVRRGSPLQDS